MNKQKCCCCCCSPKFGTCLLLWWTLFWCLVAMYVINYQFGNLHKIIQPWGTEFCRNFALNLLIFIIIVVVVALYGINVGNRHLLMPYVVYRVTVDILIVAGLFPLALDLYFNPKNYGYIGKFFKYPDFIQNDIQDYHDHVFILFIVLEFIFMAIEVHFIKIILNCFDLMEESSRSKLLRNETLALASSSAHSSGLNGNFFWIPDCEVSTAV